jgi:hypothetical protein
LCILIHINGTRNWETDTLAHVLIIQPIFVAESGRREHPRSEHSRGGATQHPALHRGRALQGGGGHGVCRGLPVPRGGAATLHPPHVPFGAERAAAARRESRDAPRERRRPGCRPQGPRSGQKTLRVETRAEKRVQSFLLPLFEGGLKRCRGVPANAEEKGGGTIQLQPASTASDVDACVQKSSGRVGVRRHALYHGGRSHQVRLIFLG